MTLGLLPGSSSLFGAGVFPTGPRLPVEKPGREKALADLIVAALAGASSIAVRDTAVIMFRVIVASLEYTWKFTGPIFLGDTVHLKIRITNMRESKSKPDRAIIWEGVQMINQRGEVVQEGEHSLMIWRRPAGC